MILCVSFIVKRRKSAIREQKTAAFAKATASQGIQETPVKFASLWDFTGQARDRRLKRDYHENRKIWKTPAVAKAMAGQAERKVFHLPLRRRQVESYTALRAFGWVVYTYVLVEENSLRRSLAEAR